jgi:hypothetical protein
MVMVSHLTWTLSFSLSQECPQIVMNYNLLKVSYSLEYSVTFQNSVEKLAYRAKSSPPSVFENKVVSAFMYYL